MHSDCVDLINAIIAGLKELAEPRAIGIHEGWRDELRGWVRCVEEGH